MLTLATMMLVRLVDFKPELNLNAVIFPNRLPIPVRFVMVFCY